MGNLLDKPLTQKTTFVGSACRTSEIICNDATIGSAANNENHTTADQLDMRFAVSSMQGRRKTQEDAHVFETCLRPKCSVQGRRIAQEDAHVFGTCCLQPQCSHRELGWGDPLPSHSLYAVFDGHGTGFASKYAARHFVGALCQQKSFIEYSQKCVFESSEQSSTGEINGRRGKRGRKSKKREKAAPESLSYSAVTMRKDDDGTLQSLLMDALHHSFLQLDADLLQEMTKRKENRDALGAAFCSGPADVENLYDEFDSGTTALVILMTPLYVICANLGDSRAVLRRGGGTFEQEGNDRQASTICLSTDHRPDCENEMVRIRNAGGVVCNGQIGGRLSVSRALGDFSFKDRESVLAGGSGQDYYRSKVQPENQMVSAVPEIVVVERDIASDKFIVLACDGIWDVVSNEECVEEVEGIFKEGEQNIGLACEELLDQCCTKGSLDNMTAFIVKFPPQQIGVGGGVLKRRKKRGEAAVVMEGQTKKYNSKRKSKR
mmetsp:Transcript_1194/g.2119  ORF Transcript_1194/g.2119 Transcript_1194/m.2119 type:complete len:491 (-) Transcript_1194:147-1619(-)